MRRLIASALLLMVVAGLLAPAALATVTAPTPACCRTGGHHHCSSGVSGGMAVQAESCPYRSPLLFARSAAPAAATQTLAPGAAHPYLEEFYPELFFQQAEHQHSGRAPPQTSSSK